MIVTPATSRNDPGCWTLALSRRVAHGLAPRAVGALVEVVWAACPCYGAGENAANVRVGGLCQPGPNRPVETLSASACASRSSSPGYNALVLMCESVKATKIQTPHLFIRQIAISAMSQGAISPASAARPRVGIGVPITRSTEPAPSRTLTNPSSTTGILSHHGAPTRGTGAVGSISPWYTVREMLRQAFSRQAPRAGLAPA
jgi:hypothetical protein